MKKIPIRVSIEQKVEFVKRHRSLFHRMNSTAKYTSFHISASVHLKKLAIEELGYSPNTYFPDTGLNYVYSKEFPDGMTGWKNPNEPETEQ